MARKKKKAEAARIAQTQAASSKAQGDPLAHDHSTTKKPGCQADNPVLAPSTDVRTIEELEGRIAAAARAAIMHTHEQLTETREHVAEARLQREGKLRALQGDIEGLEKALADLEPRSAALQQQARAFLQGDELQEMLKQLHLAFSKKQLDLESELDSKRMALAVLQADNEARSEEEDLELQLLADQLRSFEALAPQIARHVSLELAAEENALRAIELAREGKLDEAKEALELARAGCVGADLLARAEAAVGAAAHRAEVRAFIARIEAVDPTYRHAIERLKGLELMAEEEGLRSEVSRFLEEKKKLALKAAEERERELSRRWAAARRQAKLWAEFGEPRAGAALVYGPGKIEVWVPNGSGWTLREVHALVKEGVWTKRTPRQRINCRELPSKNFYIAAEPIATAGEAAN